MEQVNWNVITLRVLFCHPEARRIFNALRSFVPQDDKKIINKLNRITLCSRISPFFISWKYLFIVIITLSLFSCKKDKPPVRSEEEKPIIQGTTELKGIFICNEGNFGIGNGSVSYIDLANKVDADIYKTQNNSSLGDVVQSMMKVADKFYIIINNSGKIEVVGSNDFKHIATITGLKSPRYMVTLNSKAYVSDYADNAISVIDLNTNQRIKKIFCQGWTEELVVVDTKVYVTNMKTNYLYIIDGTTDVLDDSILVGKASSGIVIDKNKKLWVLCGDSLNNAPYKLVQVDATAKQVMQSFSVNGSPTRLKINAQGDKLYILNKNVSALPITASSFSPQTIVAAGKHIFWNIGISPQDESIYGCDAKSYSQRGYVYHYQANTGLLIDSIQVGIIPGYIYFNY